MEEFDEHWDEVGVDHGLNWWGLLNGKQLSHTNASEELGEGVGAVNHLVELVEISYLELHLVGDFGDEDFDVHVGALLELDGVIDAQSFQHHSFWQLEAFGRRAGTTDVGSLPKRCLRIIRLA
jgi:hypothetical protein